MGVINLYDSNSGYRQGTRFSGGTGGFGPDREDESLDYSNGIQVGATMGKRDQIHSSFPSAGKLQPSYMGSQSKIPEKEDAPGKGE